jgi:hypothetical protein
MTSTKIKTKREKNVLTKKIPKKYKVKKKVKKNTKSQQAQKGLEGT